MSEPRRCTVCDNPEDDHPFRHPFTAVGDPGTAVTNEKKKTQSGAVPPAPAVVAQGLGGDPVLRLALINAGVIDLAHLIAAEQQIAAAAASGRPAFATPPEAGRPEDRPAHT